MSKFGPPQPLDASRKIKKIADGITILGTSFQFEMIGREDKEIDDLRDQSMRLSRGLYEFAARLRREAQTPPPPAEESHPLFDSPKRTGCYVALMGRNPLFWLTAIDPVEARRIVDANRSDASAWTLEEWDEAVIRARDLPFFRAWMEANPVVVPDPKVPAKRPTPAKPEPGEKLGKRQCWIAKVAGRPAFRIYAHAQELAEGQLAFKVPRDSWPEASIALEFTNRSQDFNAVPMLTDLSAEQARARVRQLLAEQEHESGSGFVAPIEEPPTKVAEAGDPVNATATTWAAWHTDSGRWLFTVKASNPDEAREYCGIMLTNSELDQLAFAPVDERHDALPDWEEFDLDTWPEPAEAEIIPDPAPATPAFPTESPRDPLVMLSVEDLGLNAAILARLREAGIVFAAQVTDLEDGDLGITPEDEDYVVEKIRKWEVDRVRAITKSGEWLDEELTYAAFRSADAGREWSRLRETGATDDQLKVAINRLFPSRISGGWGQHFRAGHYFIPGPSPEFFQGGSKPKRGQEPALEGKHLVDAVRRLLAIPTREEPAAPKASKRKAVKA